jgi:hypothetical protein
MSGPLPSQGKIPQFASKPQRPDLKGFSPNSAHLPPDKRRNAVDVRILSCTMTYNFS